MIPTPIPSATELQVFWIIAVFDRLYRLGLIHEPPYTTTPESTDFFLYVDTQINELISDDELKDAVKAIIDTTSPHEVSDEDMNGFIDLVLAYKNNREELETYAMSRQFME